MIFFLYEIVEQFLREIHLNAFVKNIRWKSVEVGGTKFTEVQRNRAIPSKVGGTWSDATSVKSMINCPPKDSEDVPQVRNRII